MVALAVIVGAPEHRRIAVGNAIAPQMPRIPQPVNETATADGEFNYRTWGNEGMRLIASSANAKGLLDLASFLTTNRTGHHSFNLVR